MATFKFEDMEAVIREVVDSAVVQQFDDADVLWKKFAAHDPHVWEDDLQKLSELLIGQLKIPHKYKTCSRCDDARVLIGKAQAVNA